MSSKFLDSMLTKYQAEAGPGVVNYSSQHARMYPYVSMGAHQGAAGFAGVPGYGNALANVADSDKQCRYGGAAAASMAGMAEAMVNYSLGHQNGNIGASAAAASMAQAAAAGFYQAASGGQATGVGDPNNPLSACSHGPAPPGLGLGVQSTGGPDIPRYPWMSITGELIPFHYLVIDNATFIPNCYHPTMHDSSQAFKSSIRFQFFQFWKKNQPKSRPEAGTL